MDPARTPEGFDAHGRGSFADRPLEQALAAWLAYPASDPLGNPQPVCPPTTIRVGADAEIHYGTGRNPFHGMTVINWEDNAA